MLQVPIEKKQDKKRFLVLFEFLLIMTSSGKGIITIPLPLVGLTTTMASLLCLSLFNIYFIISFVSVVSFSVYCIHNIMRSWDERSTGEKATGRMAWKQKIRRYLATKYLYLAIFTKWRKVQFIFSR